MGRNQLCCSSSVAGLLAVGIVTATACGQIAMGPNPVPKETIIPNGAVEIPMQRLHNLPIVEAHINGQGPYRLVVDTGAPGLIVNKNIATALELPPPAKFGSGFEIKVAGPNGNGLPATFHEVRSLKLGDAEFRAVETLALDSPIGRRFDGAIGIGMLRDCLLVFDYPAGKIRLTKTSLPPANGRDVFDFTYRNPFSAPVVAVNVNETPHQFVIDTGASAWFVFSEAVTKSCPYASEPVEGPGAQTVDRKFDTKIGRLRGRLTVGEYAFNEPYGTINEGMNRALIGNQALASFVFSLDQVNQRVRLERADKSPITLPPYRAAGFGLTKGETGFTISRVRDGSPAQQAGLTIGDTVVSIDGRPTEEVYGFQAWERILKGDSVRIRTIPAGSTEAREHEIEVVTLLP